MQFGWLATAFGERLRYVTIQGGWAMDHVVERVMTSCENYEHQGREDIRAKVGQYLEKLASAGHRDVEELTYYGLAYLRMLDMPPGSGQFDLAFCLEFDGVLGGFGDGLGAVCFQQLPRVVVDFDLSHGVILRSF